MTEQLAAALEDSQLADEPAVGVDAAAQLLAVAGARSRRRRTRRVRAATEVRCVAAPFDHRWFADDVARLVAEHDPDAIPMLFGHIGQGNLHLKVVRRVLTGAGEHALHSAKLALIAEQGGNVSSEHGVGTRKRDYVSMSRTAADVAAVRAVKSSFDPTGYLNPAVLFG